MKYSQVTVTVVEANPVTIRYAVEKSTNDSYIFETGGGTTYEFPKRNVAMIKREVI